ncbi:hypothetical protein pb186bvf_012167 [Paramecium bursaria]
MYPRKSSNSKFHTSSQQQPKFILKTPDENMDLQTSYLELSKQQNLDRLNVLMRDYRRQQFINRSQQVVRSDLSANKNTPSSTYEFNEILKEENKMLKNSVKKLQLDLQQSRNQNQLLIQDFEKLRDQLERQSEEFNQAFELMQEEKLLVQQELDQKDQIIQNLKLQIQNQNAPSKTQQQIDEIKSRILARKSVHRSSRENIEIDFKENVADYNNKFRR